MRVLVIPDIHLKPWLFDRAEKVMELTQYCCCKNKCIYRMEWGA